MITPEQKQLLKNAATEALKNPFPKGSKLVFAAAVLTVNDRFYASAQFFSDTFSLTLHGEQAAIAHAAAHGEGLIKAIAVTSNELEGELSYPCHMCKQLLWENHLRSGQEIEIIVFDGYGKEETLKISEMINYPWPPKK
jgi:cytidine deaminase